VAIKAVIFGAIGTLTETSDLQRQAFNAAFAEHYLDWHWDVERYKAMVVGEAASVGGATRIARYAADHDVVLSEAQVAAVHDAKSRLYQAMMDRDGVLLNAGVDALIEEAQARGLRTVFASTTSRANVDTMLLAARPSLAGRFDLVLSGDDAAQPKPAPDIYLAALERLGFDASEVIAIEDSEPSLRAPLAAGIATFAVPGALWRGAAFDGASAVYVSLDGVRIDDLAASVGREVVDPAHV
jgi:HAD superfamily hydrolase (TIGR01509 family)